MPAPLILVAPGTQARGAEFSDRAVTLSEAYPAAIIAAGGIPWIMPCTPVPEMIAESVRRCDGVMLTGGDDVMPELFKARLSPRLRATVSGTDPARDLTEMLLLAETFRRRKPLLAICRGQQVLNVAFGGKLIVDIPSEVPGAINHCRMDRKDAVVHPIQLAEGSLLAQIFGTTKLGVNSSHHQAVREAVCPFRVSARSQDGVIEAMELSLAERRLLPYVLAVQFHPERLIKRYPEFLKVFWSFTRACMSCRKKAI